MTFLVIHGDDNRASRLLLADQLAAERAAGYEIRELDGTKLLVKDLAEALSTANLFTPETLLIENLLSRLRSKEKDLCLDKLSQYSGDKHLILWEKKGITKLALGKLGKQAKIVESKAPQLLFTLLEALVPGNAMRFLNLLHRLARSTEEILIFTMLARHVGNLLIAQSGTAPKFSPWQLAKLKSQAKLWDESSLINLHTHLMQIDQQLKTGQTKLSYLDQLDILVVSLLG